MQDVVGQGGIDARTKATRALFFKPQSPHRRQARSLTFYTQINHMTTGCSSKFGSILRPRRIFSRGLFIFSDNFGAQKRVPKLGPKMGPSFGRTIRIVLTADFGAQFWGTKNGSKNETQNRAKSPFFFSEKKKSQIVSPRKPWHVKLWPRVARHRSSARASAGQRP